MSDASFSNNADPAVEAGRDALDEWWWREYPWYDEAADGVRPIDVSEPWYMSLNFWDDWSWPDWASPSNWSWPGFPATRSACASSPTRIRASRWS